MKDDKFYTLTEACHLFDCSEQDMKDAIQNGEIKAYKRLNRWFITQEDLLNYIKGKPPHSGFHYSEPALCAQIKRLHIDGKGRWFIDMVLDDIPILTEINEETARSLIDRKVFRQCTETMYLPDEEHTEAA